MLHCDSSANHVMRVLGINHLHNFKNLALITFQPSKFSVVVEALSNLLSVKARCSEVCPFRHGPNHHEGIHFSDILDHV